MRCPPKVTSSCQYRFLKKEEYAEHGLDPDHRGIPYWVCIECGDIIKSM